MGRSSSLKSNEAVPVPKDGPIHYFVQNGEIDDGAAIGMKTSVELLSKATGEAPDSSLSNVLWSVLVNSDQLRPQLQALQAYRSKLLQAKDAADERDKHELIGTYRLLLEWSLSNDIPTPLRRAILSNLETLNSVIAQEALIIREQVVNSSLDDASNKQRQWSNPLQTLFEMLNYEPTRQVIVEDGSMSLNTLKLLLREASVLEPILDEASFYNTTDNEQPQSVLTNRSFIAAMESCVLIASTLKLFLAPVLSFTREYTLDLASLVHLMNVFSWKALTCRGMPADELNVIGVVFGQTLVFEWKCAALERESSSSSLIAEKAASTVSKVTKDALLPHQNKLAAVQGITATLSNEALVSQSPPLFNHPIASYLLEQCQRAPGSTVRLAALRALNTLVNRCLAFISADLLGESHVIYINELANGTLDVVLQAWENPPGRQVATAVPGLFRSLIKLLRNCGDKSGASDMTLKALVKRILDLPPNQKGKYLALESLVPEVGAMYMIGIARQDFIVRLIKEIGNRGQNAVAITDLLGELFSSLRVEMNDEAGLVDKSEEQRSNSKKKKIIHNENVPPDEQELPFLPGWAAMWARPLAIALVSGSASERKHISSRSIPLLVTIVGGPTRRHAASHAFCFLLDEVEAQREHKFGTREKVESYASEIETQSDRILWAKFEIARQVTLQKLMKPSNAPYRLVSSISKSITHVILESSLTHSSHSIRLAAFAAIEAVVPTYYPSDEPSLRILEKEISYWKLALPYATKCGSKEFNKELLSVLNSFINRLSEVESSSYNIHLDQSTESGGILPILTSFVCDFLITEVIVHQGAYPGTVADKEEFVLSLFHCILSFVSQDDKGSQVIEARAKSGSRCRLNPRAVEVMTMRHILAELLSDKAMIAVFSLLNSMWDSTRDKSFATLCQLVEEGHARNLSFPTRFSSHKSVRHIQARSIYLASSPRQREADTGSKMLAFLCGLLSTDEERCRNNEYILALLIERLDIMAMILGTKSNDDATDTKQGTLFGDGTKMPMAHGLMMAIRLSIENDSIHLGKTDEFYEKFVTVCCMALEQSLYVVADTEENTSPEEDLSTSGTQMRSSSTPLNVNTGAIGANAGYSSIKGVAEDEAIRRYAFQRIIMASWLMTKEACASLSSSITCKEFHPSMSLIKAVGSLLISTLTSLKHQGAAFAAHRALQVISEFCFTSSVDEECVSLPLLWAKRLVSDISGSDNVRDSTLRRSTGYALGFLSIMRSEPPSSATPRTLSPDILGTLVRLSLPSTKTGLDKYMDEIGLNSYSDTVFYATSVSRSSHFLDFEDKCRDQWRTRVHALNILRLAILDAPLASDTRLFISDAIVASLIGYEDSRWTIRNSATMVFAAAMLRVVDADKNASSSSGNAITATELFRRYPMLLEFLLRLMEKGVEDMRLENNRIELSYPSLYPVLLLLSRLQPVAISGEAAVDLTEPFIPSILKCLMHRQHKIRLVAAFSLHNLLPNDCGRLAFADELLAKCEDMLRNPKRQQIEWNSVHGALLGIQQLLSNMSNSGTLLSRQDELRARLYRLFESDIGTFRCPPPCASIALEILTNAAILKGKSALNLKRDVGRACIKVLAELQRSNSNHIGIARLGAIASRGYCECCLEEIWDPTMDSSKREPMLKSLSFLLENDIIDVRLNATKVIKKSICLNIHRLLSRSDVTSDSQRDTICDIAGTLLKALMIELNRNALLLSDNAYNLGMHPPTVRRLSRCLIECLHALWALDFSFEDDGKISATCIWEMSLNMLGLDKESNEIFSRLITDNLLNGNAVELMAFSIQAWASTNTLTNTSLRIFVEILTLISEEQASWRLRHSVAVATETSQVLQLSRMTNDFILASQQNLIGRLLVFLEDSDPDVRFVAGRAIMQAGAKEMSSFKPSTSQLVTEQGYELVSNRFSSSETSSMLLQSILESCRGVADVLDRFAHEIAQSNGNQTDLMNLGTERKIFEDEVSNSFEEVLLANHLRAVAIVKSEAPILPEDGSSKELLDICTKVVNWMFVRERTNDIAQEVTWSSITFPYFHSLLVGSTAAIIVGASDLFDLQGEARRLLSLLIEKQEKFVHASVLQALEVLASARPEDEQTKQSLVECCFLIPSHPVLYGNRTERATASEGVVN